MWLNLVDQSQEPVAHPYLQAWLKLELTFGVTGFSLLAQAALKLKSGDVVFLNPFGGMPHGRAVQA